MQLLPLYVGNSHVIARIAISTNAGLNNGSCDVVFLAHCFVVGLNCRFCTFTAWGILRYVYNFDKFWLILVDQNGHRQFLCWIELDLYVRVGLMSREIVFNYFPREFSWQILAVIRLTGLLFTAINKPKLFKDSLKHVLTILTAKENCWYVYLTVTWTRRVSSEGCFNSHDKDVTEL